MFMEINRAFSGNNTIHINALCWQNAELLYVKGSCALSYHDVWNSWYSCTVYDILVSFELAEYLGFFYVLYWNIMHCISGIGSVPRLEASAMTQQPVVEQGRLIIETSLSHSDTPHSVALLWTSDQPHAETYTWQNTTLTGDGHRTHNPSKRTAADPRLRTRGHWDRPSSGLLLPKTPCHCLMIIYTVI